MHTSSEDGSVATDNDAPAGRSPAHAIGRRELLRRAAFGGGAAAGMGMLGLAPDAAAARPTQAHVSGAPDPLKGVELFRDAAFSTFNFQALFALGGAAYGAGDVGEVIETANVINARGLSFTSYVEEFLAIARRLERIADEALKAGHRVSAREASLRAAEYYNQALFFVLGTSQRGNERGVYAVMQRQWDRAAQLFDPPLERIRIPYGKSYLPGYFLTPDRSSTKRPTVILTNGSDASNIDMWIFGGAAAIERGYNALIYEGPGQGSTLFERGIPFRPDWEKVITPIVDYLHRRRDVDTKRIALSGSSFSGELVIRAAAFEHRLAAVVSDPGSVDTWLAWPEKLRALLSPGATHGEVNRIWTHEITPHLGADDRFSFAKRSEIYAPQFLRAARAGKVFSDFWTFGSLASRYTNADVIDRVRSPALVLGYELEKFYPGQYLQLYRALRSPKKKVLFTVAEGSEYHCSPQAPQRHNQVVFDWLDDTLRT
jgi:dienelactone hydrolase